MKGGPPPPTATYVSPGLQPGAWQHPPITPGYPQSSTPGQPGYQPFLGAHQQPQQVVVVVNAPNFGKIMQIF